MNQVIRRDPEARNIAIRCVKAYEVNTSEYLQDVVKFALASFYTSVLNAEFLAHLGYEKSSSASKESLNRRNGFIHKKVRSSFGNLDISVPRDRDGTFSPISVRKHSRAVTSSESKVLAMYARGLCEEDIRVTVQKMYSYDLPSEKVQIIQDRILSDIRDSIDRPLQPIYSFVLLAKIDFKVKLVNREGDGDMSLFMIQGVDQEGHQEILDMFLCPPGPKASITDLLMNLKSRGVQDIVVLLSEGIVAKETDVQKFFPKTTVY